MIQFNDRRAKSPEQDFSEPRISGTGREDLRIGNTEISKLKVVLAGLDWLKLVAFGINVSKEVRSQLEEAKKQAAEGVETYVNLAGKQWRMRANGVGQANNHFAYVLYVPGLTLAIQKRDRSAAPGQPVAYVEAEGQYCSGVCVKDLAQDLRGLFERAGIVLERVKPGRVDSHIDVAGFHVNDLLRLDFEGKIVCRPRKFAPVRDGANWQTARYGERGSQRCFFRIYDKVEELSLDPVKEARYKAVAGLDRMPEMLTRFEMEMGGQYLAKEHNIQTVEDLVISLAAVIERQLTTWFRVCDEVDRNNTQLAVPAEWWGWMREEWKKRLKGFKQTRKRPETLPPPMRLARQAAGLLAAMAGITGVDASSPKEAFRALEHLFEVNDPAFEQKVRENRDKTQRLLSYRVEDVDPMDW